jgi:hypothetical protein
MKCSTLVMFFIVTNPFLSKRECVYLNHLYILLRIEGAVFLN